jgi:hypothetical protein
MQGELDDSLDGLVQILGAAQLHREPRERRCGPFSIGTRQ